MYMCYEYSLYVSHIRIMGMLQTHQPTNVRIFKISMFLELNIILNYW